MAREPTNRPSVFKVFSGRESWFFSQAKDTRFFAGGMEGLAGITEIESERSSQRTARPVLTPKKLDFRGYRIREGFICPVSGSVIFHAIF